MFKLTALGYYAIAIFMFFSCFSCRKSVPEGKLQEGQVAFTFDDASVENWHQYLPLLDSLHIKATFYISHYHTFGKQKKAFLKEIEQHGHEIAFHTSTHPDLAKEVAKKGLAATEQKEIIKDLELMRKDGYVINNFAYPYGSHNTQIDNCLLRRFKSVRAVSNKQNYYKSLVKESGARQIFYGAGVDENSFFTDDLIIDLLEKTRDHNDCLVLTAHEINTKNGPYHITRQRLELIGRIALEKHLKFVTINEIVN